MQTTEQETQAGGALLDDQPLIFLLDFLSHGDRCATTVAWVSQSPHTGVQSEARRSVASLLRIGINPLPAMEMRHAGDPY
jgi:hypothetical protein